MKKEDILLVADDLKYLSGLSDQVSDGEIRRGSAVVRRLLVEDVYGHAWRAIGKQKQPKLIATDISTLVTHQQSNKIVFALAAGVNFRGVQIASMCMNEGDKSFLGNEAPIIRSNGYPGEREFTLVEFLSSPSGMVGSKVFNRREVIKYIANIRGGVHLNKKQMKMEEKLVKRLEKVERSLTVHRTGWYVNRASSYYSSSFDFR